MSASGRGLPNATWVLLREPLAFLLSWLLILAPFQTQFASAQSTVAPHDLSWSPTTPALFHRSTLLSAPASASPSPGDLRNNSLPPLLANRGRELSTSAVHSRKSNLAGMTPVSTALIAPALIDPIGTLPLTSTRLFGPLLAALPQAQPQSNTSTITSNFNGTSIASGNYIWFNSVMKVSGLGNSTTNIFVKGGVVQFSANGVAYNLNVPDATITFSPNVTSASTSFDALFNRWNTSVPRIPLSSMAA